MLLVDDKRDGFDDLLEIGRIGDESWTAEFESIGERAIDFCDDSTDVPNLLARSLGGDFEAAQDKCEIRDIESRSHQPHYMRLSELG